MSHIVTIRTQVRDPVALAAAARRLDLAEPAYGEVELFSGTKTGWRVQLPNWRYPIVANIETGQVDYDNYEEKWGSRAELDRFLQAYAVEAAKLAARRKGHSCTEQQLADGSMKLTVNVGGAA